PTAKIWEAAGGPELLTLKGHSGAIESAAFSRDGQRIVTASRDKTAKVWEASSGKELLTLRGHSGWVMEAAFSQDGRRIATGSLDKTAKVWAAANCRELLTFRGHSAPIHCLPFSPDGQRIVTGSYDQTARVWQAAPPKQVAAWEEVESAAKEKLAALQREWSAEQERENIARTRDEGRIKRWLILSPIALATGQS